MSFNLDCRILGVDQSHAACRLHLKRKTTWDLRIVVTLPTAWAAWLARVLDGRWSPGPGPPKISP